MKIAIVGMGIAGISVLREWTKEQKKNPLINITVFGDASTFGTGVPYQKDSDVLLMNVPAEFTTIIPDNRDDFVEWLQTSQHEVNPRLGYYPRCLFGAYLTERMNKWLQKSNSTVIKEKVETIRILPNRKFQITSSTLKKDFDVVHLCIGTLPYKDPYHLQGHAQFIANPFPVEKKLSTIPKGARVAILGTGLTSIDIFRYLNSYRQDLKLSFFSPSGRFKTITSLYNPPQFIYFTKENIRLTKEKYHGFIPLEIYIEWFKKEIGNLELTPNQNSIFNEFGSREAIKHEVDNPNKLNGFQSLLIGMNPILTDLWMALNETDKQKFLVKYYSKWDKLLSSFPPESAKMLLSAWEDNKVDVFGGLSNIVENKGLFELILNDKEGQQADYIVNAAGSIKNASFDMEGIPLLAQLVNERIVQSEVFGGVQVAVPGLSAVSQKYGILEGFKIHGQLISGIQFGNSSVDIISDSVKACVQDLIEKHLKPNM